MKPAFSKLTTVFFTLVSFSCSAKYIIPEDKDVIKNYGQYTEGEFLDPSHIKVLVWNMYKGANPSWQEDFLNLTDGKDVLLLQEVYMNSRMSEVFSASDFGYHVATSFLNSKDNHYATGVASASKAKPSRVTFARSPDREPFVKTPKMISFSEYSLKDTDKKIVFISIHAINFVSARKLERQLSQIEEYLKAWKGHVVLGGDFNTWSKKKIKILRSLANRLGLDEVQFDPNHDGRMEVFGNKLDYIFTKGLSHHHARVYSEVLGSDHKALEVELRLK